MMASSTNIVDLLKSYPHRFSLPNSELLSIPDEEDEYNLLDESTEFENLEKELSPISIQARTNFSIVTTPISPKKSLSRSYKFVQLEHALTLANLLKNKDDRITFEHDYLESLHENKFEEFLQIYYQKLQDHHEKLKRERTLKRTQTFTFVDLEKNFLALDPTRDIKIVFIDDPITSSTQKITDTHQNSALSNESYNHANTEAFYENRSRRLLRNPSRARDEITLFARRAGECLQERLPHLSRVPHRVKIVDDRETKVNLDEHTLLQLKHKHALSLITKRRQLIRKMMIQAQKNQIKMEQLNIRTPLTMEDSSCCRELLEKINQIEQMLKEEQFKRPKTAAFISRRTLSKTTNYSSTQTTTTTTTITGSITPSFSSCSTPFQDVLSTHHVEKTNHVHIILPKRPLTAPVKKMPWVNYC